MLRAVFTNLIKGSKYIKKNVVMPETTKNIKSFKEMPGPSSLPWIGPIHHHLPGGILRGHQGVKLHERLYKQYGPIVRLNGVLGGHDAVVLFDPDAVAYVLRSEEPLPVRPLVPSLAYYRQRHNKVYDPKRITGLGTDDGESWKKLRSAVNPILMRPKTIELYSDALEEIANDMVQRFRSIRDDKHQITTNFDKEMSSWALESIAVVALGTRLNCADPDLPPDSPAKKLLRNINDVFNIAYHLDYKPSVWKIYSTEKLKKGMKIYEEFERLTKYFIDQAIKKIEKSENAGTVYNSEKPVLEKLLQMDTHIALVTATDLMLGGIDAVTITIICTLYLLAINPEKQRKLREEVLGQKTRKPYLRACIKESMRILSSSPAGNMRVSTKEYNLLGYRVPKNVLVMLAHHYMPLMEEHFPRSDEFIPERWVADKDDPLYYGNTNAFVMAPWGFGVRSCVGRRIAELEIETIISKMIENFQIEWTSSDPLQFAPSLVNYVKAPFHFDFKDIPISPQAV